MTCYKLLDRRMFSYDGNQWELGVWKEDDGVGYSAYEHPLLAVLHNPIHGAIATPRLFVAEVDGEIIRDGQLRLLAQRMRVVEEIPVPEITTAQKVAYAIHCAKAVYDEPEWNAWADRWLSGENRSRIVAERIEDRIEEQAAALALGWLRDETQAVVLDRAQRAALLVVRFAMRAALEGRAVEVVAELAARAARAAKAAHLALRAAGIEKPLDLIACAEATMRVR